MDQAWKNALAKYLVLDWVPRYIVLDKEGKIIMPKAIVEDPAVIESLRLTNYRSRALGECPHFRDFF